MPRKAYVAKPRKYVPKKKTTSRTSYRKVRGQGDYDVDPEINKSVRNIGRSIGQYFGQGDLGADIGNVGHRMFKQVTGMGDYTVKNNTVYTGNTPLFGDGKASVRIQHKEYLFAVNSSTSFAVQGFNINPGLSGLFPWLSAVAKQYQEYKIHGLLFHFVSRSADSLNSTNTALGSIMMGVDYNVLASAPTSKQELLNLEFSGVSKPSEDLITPLECDPKQSFYNNLFIRAPFAPIDGDLRLSDFAKLYICTDGSQAVSQIGDMYVTYDISLYKTKMSKLGGLTDHFEFTNASTTYYFGIDHEKSSVSNFGCYIDNDSIHFPDYYEGQVMINYHLVGASTSYSVPTLTVHGNVIPNLLFENNTVAVEGINATSTKQMITASYSMIKADVPGENKIVFSGGTLVTSVAFGDLVVCAVNMKPLL